MEPREIWDAWERDAVKQLGTAIRAARESQGMAQRALAEAAGVDRGTIAKLESEGDSRVSELPKLALILKLAVALNIPPISLLYPNLPDGKVAAWPSMQVPSITALRWFSGEIVAEEVRAVAEGRQPDRRKINDEAEHSRQLRNSRERAELLDAIRNLRLRATKLDDSQAIRDSIQGLESEVAAIELMMRADGWPVDDDA